MAAVVTDPTTAVATMAAVGATDLIMEAGEDHGTEVVEVDTDPTTAVATGVEKGGGLFIHDTRYIL